MLRIPYFLAVCSTLLTLPNPAQAHFLFIRIGLQAEAGRAAEVYFSELATAGDPRFIEKVAHTQLWLQSAPGETTSLEVRAASDRLRVAEPSACSARARGYRHEHRYEPHFAPLGKTGTVVGRSIYVSSVAVLLDGNKSPITIHGAYLEAVTGHVDEPFRRALEPEAGALPLGAWPVGR